jgi:hypothetical protein
MTDTVLIGASQTAAPMQDPRAVHSPMHSP